MMIDTPERVAAAYLQRVADNYSGVAFLGDAEGRLIHLSAWFYDYTGLEPAPDEDFAILRAAHPDDRERLLQGWNDAASKRRPFRAAFRLQRRDGEWEWFWSNGRLMGSSAHEEGRWLAVCVRVEDAAAMQLAGYDGLASTLSRASDGARPMDGEDAPTDPRALMAGSGLHRDLEWAPDGADPSGVRLTAAASYALAAALLIEDGSATALAKAQEVLSQLSRELVQLSHATSRRRPRSA